MRDPIVRERTSGHDSPASVTGPPGRTTVIQLSAQRRSIIPTATAAPVAPPRLQRLVQPPCRRQLSAESRSPASRHAPRRRRTPARTRRARLSAAAASITPARSLGASIAFTTTQPRRRSLRRSRGGDLTTTAGTTTRSRSRSRALMPCPASAAAQTSGTPAPTAPVRRSPAAAQTSRQRRHAGCSIALRLKAAPGQGSRHDRRWIRLAALAVGGRRRADQVAQGHAEPGRNRPHSVSIAAMATASTTSASATDVATPT